MIAVPAHMPKPKSDMPITCPRKGKINTASTLNRKIVEMENTISLSFAPITGASAAMAEPPQMEVPAPISVLVSSGIFSSLPTHHATAKEVSRVKIITYRDWDPTSSTLNKFISKPSRIMEYCKIFLPVKLIPALKDSPRGIKAQIMPSRIPKTGPPIIGYSFPR